MKYLMRLWREVITAEKGYGINPAWKRKYRKSRIAPLLRLKIALANIRWQDDTSWQTADGRMPVATPEWKAHVRESSESAT